jgi:hypothetical protein
MRYSAAQVEHVVLAQGRQSKTGNNRGRFGVASVMRGKRILAVLALLALGVLAYAWIDGGREPLRDIAVPVTVPESAQ